MIYGRTQSLLKAIMVYNQTKLYYRLEIKFNPMQNSHNRYELIQVERSNPNLYKEIFNFQLKVNLGNWIIAAKKGSYGIITSRKFAINLNRTHLNNYSVSEKLEVINLKMN